MPTLSAMTTVMELVHEAQKFAAPYVTTENVALGVVGMLGSAGVMHGLPGPQLRMQAAVMGMPAWFIMCAGWLMVGSGIGYHFLPGIGLFFVALCMGGAVATAAKMPSVMHRPGGMVFSNATLAAALWVMYKEKGEITRETAAICAACYLAGIAGRVLVPTNPLAVRLLGWIAGKEEAKEAKAGEGRDTTAANVAKLFAKSEAAASAAQGQKKEASPPSSASGPAARAAAATGGAAATAATPTAKAGARKRVASPAPTAGK